jgi:hypothetical protein
LFAHPIGLLALNKEHFTMNWFFWLITLATIAAFGMAIKPCKDNFIRASRNLRFIFVYLVYLIYYIASKFDPAAFFLANGNYQNVTAATILLIGGLAVTACLPWYLMNKPMNEQQQKEVVKQLKRLKWRQASFDSEAFRAEWKNLFRRQ